MLELSLKRLNSNIITTRKNSVGVDTEYIVIKLPKDKEIKEENNN